MEVIRYLIASHLEVCKIRIGLPAHFGNYFRFVDNPGADAQCPKRPILALRCVHMRFSAFQPTETSRSPFRFDIAPAAFSFGRPNLLRHIVSLSICLGVAFLPVPGQATGPAAKFKDTDPVVHALCGKSVALLGESPVHGFGKTLEFKVELVRRLIDECHYNAVFVESGTYDYINIQKKLKSGQDVTDSMISAAIGGLWATKEVQPLIPFLREKVKAGSVTLGGLDDQLGMGTYAQREMPSDLVQYLQGDERSRCLATLQRHMLWQYTDDAPYGAQDRDKIVGCLDRIEARLSQPGENQEPWAEEDRAMIDSLKRNLARDFREGFAESADSDVAWNERDRSMYLNFRWLLSRLPSFSKVIVWAATVHAAKDLSGVSGLDGRVPLGSYLRRDFKDRAFTLGFSEYSGSYAFVGQPVRQLSAAPDASLERRSLANRDSDIVYLSLKQLRKFGSVEARPLGSSFKTARWDDILDGLVVFREERAPQYLHH
jgi:erythromycin esterase-like protein